MNVIPITLRQANEFVKKYHRHNIPVVGCRFAIGATKNGKLVGVAIVGRPIARLLDNGITLEILRTCTDGTKNANSFLYGAIKRIATEMGYKKIITYTLISESGSSLKAIGAKLDKTIPPYSWNRNGRPRKHQSVYEISKQRWIL